MNYKIQVGNYLINYTTSGNGPNHILCLYGYLGTHHDYEYQLRSIDQELFTVVVWDAPGYGYSRPPDVDDADHSFQEKADMVYEFMQAMNIQNCYILGWCSGGTIAIFLAAKYPQVVRKMVLWGTYPYVSELQYNLTQAMVSVDRWSDSSKQTKLDVYGVEYLQTLIELWSRTVEKYYMAGDVCQSVLEQIQCPTLVLHGEKEFYIALDQAECLSKGIRNSRFEIYPEAKHNLHQKFSEKFNRQVETFFLEK